VARDQGPVTDAVDAVDLFAGPGGWDLAAAELGLNVLGVELDDAACDTREAAGLPTFKGDVAALNPSDVAASAGYAAGGLIASPPCQAWSMAGKGDGQVDKANVFQLADAWAAGEQLSAADFEWADARSPLVCEPVRWARALAPTWMAFEQVPPVLELWEVFARYFRSWGYNTWTGVLTAEQYGVPQTRQRAILLAHRDRVVKAPPPTHQRYIARKKKYKELEAEHTGLFGHDEPPGRVVHVEDRNLLPWVSMGEALGCVDGRRLRNNTQSNAALRGQDEPAPTMFFGARMNDVSWVGERPEGWGWNPRQNGGTVRDGSEPAPTVLADGLAKGVPVWDDERNCPESGPNAARITLEEAAVLQSFPPDYPFKGSRSKQFEQVGNAVPPKLAKAVLRELQEGTR
jgi:DNA (cytosine-5)-methyltransferase 1